MNCARWSKAKLPDLVAALHNAQVDFNLVGRIDSVKGGIRNTFETVPDAPVTKFTLELLGGKKSLLINSTNICKGRHRAIADFTGQNGKKHVFNPALEAKCPRRGGRGLVASLGARAVWGTAGSGRLWIPAFQAEHGGFWTLQLGA